MGGIVEALGNEAVPTVEGRASKVRASSASSVRLEPISIEVPMGEVRDAWEIVEASKRPDGEVFLLPPGEVMQVPDGAAVAVQSGKDWLHCEFPLAGTLHGPLVWAHAEAKNPETLALKEFRNSGKDPLQWSLTGALALSFLSPFVVGAAGLSEAVLVAALVGNTCLLVGGSWVWSMLLRRGLGVAGLLRKLNRRETREIPLVGHARHLAGYSPLEIEQRIPDHETDEIDEAIGHGLANYHAARRRMHRVGATSNATLDHTSRMISQISQRIQSSPHYLRDRELRAAFQALLARAERDVEAVIAKKEAVESSALLADVTTLMRQLDRHSR